MGQFSFGKANSYPVLQPIWDIECFRVILLRLSQHGAEGISTGQVEVSVTQTTLEANMPTSFNPNLSLCYIDMCNPNLYLKPQVISKPL
jgi:hypothetical protein